MKHNAQFNVRRSVEKLEKKVALNCSFKIWKFKIKRDAQEDFKKNV